MVINCLNHVNHCYSHEDGEIILNIIRDILNNKGSVIISFSGVNGVPSSFVNAAFIPLLEEYSFDDVRKRVHFINSTKQINDMIKKRFEFEVYHRQTLVIV